MFFPAKRGLVLKKRDYNRFFVSFIITTITLLLIMGIALADSRIKAMTGYEGDETALAFSVNGQKKLELTVFNDRYGVDVGPLDAALSGYRDAAKVAGRLVTPALDAAKEIYYALDSAAFPIFSKLSKNIK
jgi:hypothetical protein